MLDNKYVQLTGFLGRAWGKFVLQPRDARGAVTDLMAGLVAAGFAGFAAEVQEGILEHAASESKANDSKKEKAPAPADVTPHLDPVK